jgi:hypothetical protein
MEAGGVLPDPPTSPVRPTPEWPETPRLSFGDARQKSRAKREAFDAVRHRAAGKTRGELRVMLREEYKRRDIPVSQLKIEVAIDMIERRQTPLGTVTATIQGVGLIANQGWRLAKFITNVVREGDLPDRPERPAWLEPPEEAAYPVGRNRQRDDWMSVELDADAGEPGELVLTGAREGCRDEFDAQTWRDVVGVHSGDMGAVAPRRNREIEKRGLTDSRGSACATANRKIVAAVRADHGVGDRVGTAQRNGDDWCGQTPPASTHHHRLVAPATRDLSVVRRSPT